MRAAIVPSIHGKWQIKEVPTPKAGINEVLIKIKASGLCYTDVHITEGELPMPIEFPRTIGHEPVGEIVEVGQGVTSRQVGDRVGVPWLQTTCGRCEWCLRGKYIFCEKQIGTGIGSQGGHAEYMVADADSTMLLPKEISYEQAAPIFCAGYTVYSGLRHADPKPHEKIAIVGIGGLGHLGVQYSKACGFETIAVTHSNDKEDLCYKMGADLVVKNTEELKKAGGADVILATSNSNQAASEAISGLRPDGRVMIIGFDSKPIQVPPMILLNRARIMGSQQNSREYLYEALDYVAKGKVKVIAETFSLEEIGKAYEKVANGHVRFRAVIKN
ncbi:MAG: alcohol dehydrogenase catalytic domain-containing protein [Thaumarchaeota archaeon]|nr:alcohol dehydrogenase catalytic domain-containing protein [Nitrososphaerota archaeon]